MAINRQQTDEVQVRDDHEINYPEYRSTLAQAMGVSCAKKVTFLELDLNNTVTPSDFTPFRRQRHTIQQYIDPSKEKLGSSSKSPFSMPEHGTVPKPETGLHCLIHPQLYSEIGQITQNEAKQIYTL